MDKIIQMGNNYSFEIEQQEQFVHKKVDQFRTVLPKTTPKRQIEGKLRQMYHHSDMHYENRDSYISDHIWLKAKRELHIK